MGNNAEKERETRINEPQGRLKVLRFVSNVGRLTGDALREWVDENYSDNLYSVTHTRFIAPTYRRDKEELIQVLEQAYRGKWKARLLTITDVYNYPGSEVVLFNIAYEYFNKPKLGQSIELFCEAKATFDKKTGL